MFENLNWTEVQTCTAQRWSPVIGDPNVTGWLTVAAYLTCALLAVAVAGRAGAGRQRRFWMLTALAMAFLAVNKQLDLQSALTAVGRCVAQMQGWYGARRGFQLHFIEGLLVALTAILALGLYRMRHDLRRNGLALLGLAVVAGFVAVRAVGFHHIDALINTRVLSLRFNFIFEVSGLVLIALNAVALLRRAGRP